MKENSIERSEKRSKSKTDILNRRYGETPTSYLKSQMKSTNLLPPAHTKDIQTPIQSHAFSPFEKRDQQESSSNNLSFNNFSSIWNNAVMNLAPN